MRTILSILLGVCAATSMPFAAHAHQYSVKVATIVLPTGPGASYDLGACRLEKALAKYLGQSVVIRNRPDSGMLVGAMSVLNAAPDGDTLLMGGASNIFFNGSMYKKKPYNPLTDLVGIGIVAQSPYVMISRPDLAERDAAGSRKFAQANPGKLNIATAGAGSEMGMGLIDASRAAGGGIVRRRLTW